MSAPPPPYSAGPPAGVYQPQQGYGTPAGAYQPVQGYGPPAGAYDPSKGMAPPPGPSMQGYGPPAGAYDPSKGMAPPPGPSMQGYGPPAGAYDPSKGMAPPPGPPAGSVPSYQNYNVTVTQPTSQVVVVGGCPACRVGILEDDFTCLGVLCAILFFPLGILCCLAMRQRRCANCGAVYG